MPQMDWLSLPGEPARFKKPWLGSRSIQQSHTPAPSGQAGVLSERAGWWGLGPPAGRGGLHPEGQQCGPRHVQKHISREGPDVCSKQGPQKPEGGWDRATRAEAPRTAAATLLCSPRSRRCAGRSTHRECVQPS